MSKRKAILKAKAEKKAKYYEGGGKSKYAKKKALGFPNSPFRVKPATK